MTHLLVMLLIVTKMKKLMYPTSMGESEMKKFGNRGLVGDRSFLRRRKCWSTSRCTCSIDHGADTAGRARGDLRRTLSNRQTGNVWA